MPVEFKNLQCVRPRTDFELRPLEELEVFDHVHGCIILRPENGVPLNGYGFWDSESSCLGEWLKVFTELHALIEGGGTFTYEFPYPDQGEPKLEFIFLDDEVRIRFTDDESVAVIESWEQSTPRAGFEPLVGEALALIETTILTASPITGRAWLDRQRGG